MDYYCSDFICTYKNIDDELKDDLYKSQFLQAFNLKKWNYKKIKISIEKIYELIKVDFMNVFETIKQSNNQQFMVMKLFPRENDDVVMLEILFAYDYFDLLHKCICEKINNKYISEISLNNLINKIKSE